MRLCKHLCCDMNTEDYKKYKTKNVLAKWLINRFLSTVTELVDISGAQNILDAGCGQGFVANFLLQRIPNVSIVGIDIDIELIKTNIVSHNARNNILVGDVYNLPFRDNVFDMVMCFEVLEHLSEPQYALQELARVSKSYCMFSVPNEPYFQLMTFLRGRYIKRLGNHPDHINNWTKHQFLEMINSELVTQLVRTPFPWVVALCKKGENP